MYRDFGIASNGLASWSFGNDFDRNVSRFRRRKFGLPEKRFSTNLTKVKTNFFLSLHSSANNRYLF